MFLTEEEVAQDFERYGKIFLEVSRGTHVQMSPRPWLGFDAPDTTISSKNLVQANRVSHVVK
jgi:hypothetical protein